MIAPMYALGKLPSAVLPHVAEFTAFDVAASLTNALVTAIHARGGDKVATAHVATDHSWSDHRIELEGVVINWLSTLK